MTIYKRDRQTIEHIKSCVDDIYPKDEGWIIIVFNEYGWYRHSKVFITSWGAINSALSQVNHQLKLYGKPFVYYKKRKAINNHQCVVCRNSIFIQAFKNDSVCSENCRKIRDLVQQS